MKQLLQIFVIWEHGRTLEDKILQDIQSKYDILQVFSINWPSDEFAANISRLYGKKIPKSCKKEKECGTGAFTLVVGYDTKPHLVNDPKHPGIMSNANAMRDKYTYRQWTGGGYLVHASDNQFEAAENLLFMLGMTVKEIEEKYQLPWNGKTISINQSMIGSRGWKDLDELKEFIRKLPQSRLHATTDEIILTTADFAQTSRLLNLKKRFTLFKKNEYKALIGGQNRQILLKTA